MESFIEMTYKGNSFIAYNYILSSGKIFATNKSTLAECRKEKNNWLKIK